MKTGFKTELIAGATTFVTMAYITAVNPALLSQSGMPATDVFFATCVSSAAACFLMGLYARYPFALAPGMGLNAFFAFTVCGRMGIPWQTALACVLVSGIAFLVLSLVGLREKLIRAVPPDLVRAISAGIGLFIAFIGLEHAGIAVDHPTTLVTLGDLSSPTALTAICGLVATVALVAMRIPGALLLGMAVAAICGGLFGIASAPESWVQLPAWPTETFGAALFSLGDLLRPGVPAVLFTMFFLDLFDTMGTLLALGTESGHVDARGNFPRVGRAFTADAVGTVIGSLFGTSTVTTYIESASGIAAGGRDGRTAMVTGGLFLLALPFFPAVAAVPAAATAPVLIVVGAMMFSAVSGINWKDPVVAVPSLATLLIMPATYSISNGLGAGFILYVISHIAARRFRALHPAVVTIAVAFLIYFTVSAGA